MKLLLEGLKKRLVALNITLTVDESAESVILEHGYNPEFGARPLKRTIQRKVEDLLSNAIIDGKLKSGDAITLYGEDGVIRFSRIN